MLPVKEKIVTPQAYLREVSRGRDNIEKVEFIPPVVGKRGFGRFRIRYKIPVLVDVK